MRGSLLHAPKVIALARRLRHDQGFREWFAPRVTDDALRSVTDCALRYVTVALLLRVWSVAREHGHFDGNDLVMAGITACDLDQIAGVAGFGAAMLGVGWA